MNYSIAASLMTRSLMKLDLLEAIAQLAAAGFKETELSGRETRLDPNDPGYNVNSVLRALRESGMKAPTCHAPFGPQMDLGSEDASFRKAGLDSLRSLLEPCAMLGVETVVVHPNFAPKGQTDEAAEASKARIRESMTTAVDFARPYGLRLAFENMLSVGRSQPCGSMSQLAALVDGLPGNAGLCLDTGHAFANGLDPAAEVHAAGDRLIALHVHDNDGERDRHWPPGRGGVDWPAFLGALRKTKFSGAWTLEVLARDEDAAAILEETKRVAEEWGPPAGG